jgi:regulator of sigma E protease
LEILNSWLTIAKVALGLGFVIFVHELGHFLLAKWNGVKVEKFSIGFGPTLFGWTRGETEYVLAALPLGGFVKMLGEGPDEKESQSTDPRAYPNKSVSARMAIISAGVIMNLLLAVACFAYFSSHERHDAPAVLGTVVAGSPAYEAGLRVGDEIVAIDGRRDLAFTDLLQKVLLSANGQVLHFEIKRPGHTEPISIEIQPRREANSDRPTIGIKPASSLEIVEFQPLAGMVSPPEYHGLAAKDRKSNVDVLVAVTPEGGEKTVLTDCVQYNHLRAVFADKKLTHFLERRALGESQTPGPATSQSELVVPVNPFVDFGFRLEGEPISSVRRDSVAEKAGFRKGDRILKVNGEDFDPMRLPGLCFASAGKPVAFEVERDVPGGGQKKTETITATPDDTPPRTDSAEESEPVDVAGLGFCYPVGTHIASVLPESPAAKAGLKAGDTINSMSVPVPASSKPPARGVWAWISGLFKRKKVDPPRVFEFSDKAPNWFAAFVYLQSQPITQVELVVNHESEPRPITPRPATNWFNPARGFFFYPQIRSLPPQGLAAALKSGYELTIQNVVAVYATFRSLAERRVSTKNLGGPIMIFGVAYSAASSSFVDLIYFLGLLSVNLAVLNFLPIPPLDGGQMLFLIAEKVRGRPLPESALIAGTYFGLILVLSLMVFVTYQDVFRFFIG